MREIKIISNFTILHNTSVNLLEAEFLHASLFPLDKFQDVELLSKSVFLNAAKSAIQDVGSISFTKFIRASSLALAKTEDYQSFHLSQFDTWEIDGETVGTVSGFYFFWLQNHCRWWLQPWN